MTECLQNDPKTKMHGFCERRGKSSTEVRSESQVRSSGPGVDLWQPPRPRACAVAAAHGGNGMRSRICSTRCLKRFVALLNWPKSSDGQVTPMLTGVLAAIKSELARVEAFDRDFFVISPEDISLDITGASHLKEICDPLGANLVLAATGLPQPKHFQLLLRLLDPLSGRPTKG